MRKMLIAQTLLFIMGASPALAVVGGGDITMHSKEGKVVFSHEDHVAGAELQCQACHPILYINTAQHRTATMQDMQKGASCGTCHNGDNAFSVKENCDKCHMK
jgi:c(7)-type cytochrome triheme protein